jgi:hypothetical protein
MIPWVDTGIIFAVSSETWRFLVYQIFCSAQDEMGIFL